MLEEVSSRREVEDREEIKQWRTINQEEIDNLWKEFSGKMEEVLVKYKVKEAKRGHTEDEVNR